MSAPADLEALRRCWGCDCDGVSHESAGKPKGGPHRAVAAMSSHIEELTGHAPYGCPWRAFYDPTVRNVIHVATLAEKNMGSDALGPDPDSILLDGLALYLRAQNATASHDMEIERKQREARMKRK